jgi:hypothetical protein
VFYFFFCPVYLPTALHSDEGIAASHGWNIRSVPLSSVACDDVMEANRMKEQL